MKRIVISGTYCTGKTTLSLALAYATGIPATHALTMRQILPQLYPGKSLRQCTYIELLTLGMKRFEDRIRTESILADGFISDGCPLQEWLYGSTRMLTGAYPDESPFQMKLKHLLHWNRYRDFKKLLRGFEGMAKQYTRHRYDIIFHLPVEFPFVADGHRPTSEQFREASENLLLSTYKELGLSPHWISGSPENRLQQILQVLNISAKYPLDACIQYAEQQRRELFDAIKLEK